jgi:hypothetical protein
MVFSIFIDDKSKVIALLLLADPLLQYFHYRGWHGGNIFSFLLFFDGKRELIHFG